ncbi:putative ABC transport system permease protein [Desulfobotulus alkaliphilus]|uniref:Putative ABC transport system permease protein n=1 Tax=Desulfobotulus alkaliphilus TaxID=622671 RepID=A0A562RXZ2_9BACT|nr:ABC transporter permease [Desulfobotulus alkaliphilus]TWI73296.1 putative ABC transport system permease protein [Desulfobotulus alkaliphilus]
MKFFFFLLFRISLRHLLRQKLRTLAALLAIALGASVFSSVRMAIDGAGESFASSVTQVTGRADYHLSAGPEGIPEGLMADFLHHPDILRAAPFSSVYVLPDINNKEGERPFLLMGLDPFLDTSFRQWEPESSGEEENGGISELVTRPGAMLVTQTLARRLGIRHGDSLRVLHGGKPAEMHVAGILEEEGLAMAEAGGLALCDMATFQESTGRYGLVDRMDLRLHAGADKKALEAMLPAGVQMQPATAFRDTGLAMVKAYRMNLLVMGFVSLFVGMFLVYSVVALNAASRSGEVAMLRAMGVAKVSIFLLFITEGLLLGIMGWLFSLPLTLLGYPFLQEGVGKTLETLFFGKGVAAHAFQFQDLWLTLALTLFVAAIAALYPALSAMAVSPKMAMAERGFSDKKTGTGNLRSVTGLGLLVAVPFSAGLPAMDGLPLGGYMAAFFLFGGTALVLPWILARLGPGMALFLGRRFGVSAFLAARQFRESGGRIALAAGALTTAVALFVALSIMITSFRETVRVWVDQSIGGDLFIRSKMAELNDYRYPLSHDLVAQIEELQSWDALGYRRVGLERDGLAFDLEAMDMETLSRYGGFLDVSGTSSDAYFYSGHGPLPLLVSEPALHLHGLDKGQILDFYVDGVSVPFEVKAVVRDFRTRTLALFCDMEALAKKTGKREISGMRLFYKMSSGDGGKEKDAALELLRDQLLKDYGDSVDVVAGLSLRNAVLDIFDETFAVTFVLLAMALGIAGLGIATTMTLRVMVERVGLLTLRSLGASAFQVRSMVRWEAGLLLAFSLVAGLACGFVLSYLLIHGINKQSFGWTFFFALDGLNLLAGILMIFAAGMLAAGPAMALALRGSPAEALREGTS